MTTDRKLLIGLGALVIACMVSGASFSLGFFIGAQGWSIQSPSSAGPGAGPGGGFGGQPGGQSQQGFPGQISPRGGAQQQQGANQQPRPDLIGIIVSVTDDSLELETQEGFRMVTLTDETIVALREEDSTTPADRSELQRGVRVAVVGEFGDDGQTMTARVVVILPEQAR
ncbi:MAG: hypothetical protein FVQ83_03820 [Chloroflexi bacterium]|nr:hypothetical protein [Chloroflexota bacterium]